MRILRGLTVFFTGVALLSLAACSKPPVKLKDGGYSATDIKGVDATGTSLIKAATMTIERGNMRVSFGLPAGKIIIPLKQTKQDKWPSGCGHSLEFIEFMGALTVKTLVVSKPVLVVGCPVESGKIILREAGKIDGDNPCEGATGACITWTPK